MHIGHLLHVFLPQTDTQNFINLGLKQGERGNRVKIIAPHDGPHTYIALSENVALELLPAFALSMPKITSYYPYVQRLGEFIRTSQFDVLHLHSHLFLTTIQAIVQAKKFSIPVITHIHGIMAKRGVLLNAVQNLYLYTIGHWIFRNSNLIICETNDDALETMKFGCERKKIRIIPNAVDMVQDLSETRLNKEINDEIVWIGRFVPEKGLRFLLKSMKKVVEFNSRVVLNLIGDGPLRTDLEKAVKKEGLSCNVKFLGLLSHDRVMKSLMDALIFVLPSLREGCPRSLLEAMALGKPAVVFDFGGVNEIIQNNVNGRVVGLRDSMGLADAIIDLLQNSQARRRMGEMARNTVLSNYSWNVILPELEKTYEEAIKIAG